MKTNLDSIFKTNVNHEEDGVDFEISDTVSFRLRRFHGSNPRMKAALAAYYKPYARQVENNTLDPKKQREITVSLFIDVSLVSWKGVEIDGKEAECKREVALPFFMELPELFDTLFKYANDFNSYRDDVGNS